LKGSVEIFSELNDQPVQIFPRTRLGIQDDSILQERPPQAVRRAFVPED
jgi:hypothetical protein